MTIWAALLVPGVLSAQQSLCDTAPAGALMPSRDLYCLVLVPSPDVQGVSGEVELGRAPDPFTIAVTADGRIRYAPAIALAGLPAPSSLGAYTTYVAWLATPVMYPIVRLGAVGNGKTKLPEIALDKFVVLVTAERSAAGTEPAGRVVLRGESPSTRLQPPDLMRFAIGAASQSPGGGSADGHMRHGMAMPSSGDSVQWTT